MVVKYLNTSNTPTSIVVPNHLTIRQLSTIQVFQSLLLIFLFFYIDSFWIWIYFPSSSMVNLGFQILLLFVTSLKPSTVQCCLYFQKSEQGTIWNTGLVWYLNGRFVSGCQMARYSNVGLKKPVYGPMVHQVTWHHLNTGHPYSPVFRCSVFRWLLSLEDWCSSVSPEPKFSTICLLVLSENKMGNSTADFVFLKYRDT